MNSRPRPLSPHIQIYSWLITSTLSILHRLTGVALSLGLFLLVAWVLVLAYYPNYYETFSAFLRAPIGTAVLVGFTFSIYYHLANGIRHLFWDFGKGFELSNMAASGYVVLIFTIGATAATWGVVLGYLKI